MSRRSDRLSPRVARPARRWLAASCLGLAVAWAAAGAAAQPLAPAPALDLPAAGAPSGEPCAGGVVLDDGVPESGYGWVPSAIEGEYVQAFDTGTLSQRVLDAACVCMLRTGTVDAIDFEVVVYASREVVDDQGEVRVIPEAEPFAAVPARLDGVPTGVQANWIEVPLDGLRLPLGRFYLGARWDPSVAVRFFVCVDQTETTDVVGGFFRDDRSEGIWTSVFATNDPIFIPHRSMLLRLRGSDVPALEVPALSPVGLAALAAGLMLLGLLGLARRR